MIHPKVSVCIPLYNGAAYIRDAIDSVRAQTYSGWELVITDDASTDGSAEIVASYGDPRIRYFLNEKRLGAEGNWNCCVNEAKGAYIKLLCHDDRLHPECIQRQFDVLEDPENESVSLVSTARKIITPSGKKILTRRWKRKNQRIPGHQAIRQIARSGTNMIGEPSAVLFRATDWDASNQFSDRYPYVIDLEFWFQLLLKGDCFYIADPLSDFRISEQSWSFNLAEKQCSQFSGLINEIDLFGDVKISWMDKKSGVFSAKLGAFLRSLIYRKVF